MMNIWIGILIGVVVALTGVTIAYLYRRDRVPTTTPDAVLDPDELIVPPPSVRGTSVRDWITYYTHRYTWADVVRSFYGRASQVPEIASYFHRADMMTLPTHFSKAMILLTEKGLTRGQVADLGRAHGRIRDKEGRPITGPIFDQTVAVLVQTLEDHGVPGDAIGELARAVPDLRAALVQ